MARQISKKTLNVVFVIVRAKLVRTNIVDPECGIYPAESAV